MEIRIIENEEQYQAYLARIEELFEVPPGSPEANELELLALLVNKYEEEHYPISTPDPIEFIKVRMEDLGLKDKDMVPYLGDKAIVSKILNRKRKLSIDMIRRLHKELRFPLDVLVQDYEVAEFKGLNATVGKSYRNIKRLPNPKDAANLRQGNHS